MPVYVYVVLDENDNPTLDYFEVIQHMSDEPLTHDPETGDKVRRVPQAPNVIVDSKKAKTIGDLAEENTERMIKEGDSRVHRSSPKDKPFWRSSDKPLDIRGKTNKQLNNYVRTGKFNG